MTETKPKRRWLYPLLFLSLAVNLLILGIVVGWMASPDRPSRSEFGTARGLVGEPFVRALPSEHRRAMLRALAKEAPRIRESRESLRARFEAFLTAVEANPYDRDAVAKLLKEQRTVALHRQDLGERALLDRLAEMTPEERGRYAAKLKKSLRRLRQPSD